MLSLKRISILLILVLPYGCETVNVETVQIPATEASEAWAPVTPTESEAPPLLGADPESTERQTRRLTVDQLRRAIPDLFGGETWNIERAGREFNLIDSLASTLGEADYNEITTPLTDPSPLFQKFMDDMAGQMCSKAVQSDGQTASVSDRLVVKYPDDLDANLRFLRLKFHGIYVAADAALDGDGLNDLRRLFSDIASSEDEQSAWIGVCMAMVTSPEFLAY